MVRSFSSYAAGYQIASARRSSALIELLRSLVLLTFTGAVVWAHAQSATESDPRAFQSIVREVEALGQKGDFEAMLPLLEKANSLSRATFGESDARTRTIRSLYTAILIKLGRVGVAIPLLRQVIGDLVAEFGPSHPETLDHRFSLGRALVESTDGQQEGVAEIREVYRDSQRYLGPSHIESISRGIYLSALLGIRGHSKEALQISDEVFAVARVGPLEASALKSAYAFRAHALRDAGRLEEAIAVLDEALSSPTIKNSERVGEFRADLRGTKCSLAGSGDSRKVELCEDALRAEQALRPSRPLRLIVLQQDFALAHLSAGKPSLAANLLELTLTSLGVDRESETQRSFIEAILADAYREMGRYPEALSFAEAARKRLLATVGPASPYSLGVTHKVATILRQAGRLSEHSQFVEAERKQFLQAQPSVWLSMEYEWAEVLRARGDASAALSVSIAAYEKAKSLFGDLSNPATRDHARQVVNLASRSELVPRADTFQLAVAIYEQDLREFGRNSPTTIRASASVGYAAIAAGKSREYFESIGRTLDLVEGWRDSAPLLSDERVHLWESFSLQIAPVVSLPDSGGDVQAQHELQFVVAERAKTSARFESMALESLERRSGDGALQALAQEFSLLTAQISESADPVQRAALYNGRFKVEQKYAKVASSLLENLTAEERRAIRGVVDPRKFAGVLAPKEVYLSYLLHEGYGALFVQAAGGVRRFRIDAGPPLARSLEAAADLVAAVPGTTKKLWKLPDGSFRYAGMRGEGSWLEAGEGDLFSYLGRVLVEPTSELLQGKTRLVISPDGALWRIPFEVLIVGNGSLVKNFAITYAPSAPIFELMRQRKAASSGKKRRVDLIAIGAPSLSTRSAVEVSAGKGVIGDRGSRAKLSLLRAEDNPKARGLVWDALPGAELELARVAAQFEADRVMVLIGAAASEATLRELSQKGALQDAKYLLFATHGYLAGKDPNLNALVLTGANDPNERDGYLTAAEIAGLNLGSQLVVLSACETAKGPYTHGDGIASLAAAISLAGAGGVLATLWPVVDDTTADFMTKFFKRLSRGEDEAEALAATKREFLRDRRTGAPLFWAPFVLFGG